MICQPLFLKISFAVAVSCATWASSAGPAAESDLLKVDREFVAALNRGDRAAVDQKTDADFSWTDRAGKTHSKSETLAGLNGLAGEEDSDVQVIGKGPIVLVRGIHRIPAQNASVRFVRAWIQHSAGWRLMVYQETTKAEKNPEKRSGFGAPSGGATVTCENPCNTMPYHPETAGEKEVADMWQAVERTVLTNDVEAWIPNFTDDFIFVTPDGGDPLNKADRVTMIKQLKSTNTTLIPAEVASMKIWVEGNSALMRSEHKPRHGKVLHVTRLFVKDNGHWQIAFGQQTAIE